MSEHNSLKRPIFPPLNFFGILVKSQLILNIRVYFRSQYSTDIYIYIPPKTESHYNGYMYVYVGVGGRFLVSITLCFSYLVLFFFNIGHFRQYGSYSGFLLTYFPNISLCYILAIWSVTWLTILLKFIFFNNVKYLMPVL